MGIDVGQAENDGLFGAITNEKSDEHPVDQEYFSIGGFSAKK